MLSWESAEHDLKTASGADGSFELRGKPERKRGLGLIARLSGWLCLDPAPFEPGATGIRIVMTRAGGIEGSFKGLGDRSWGRYGDAPFRIVVTGRKAWITARNDGHQSSKGYELAVLVGAFQTHELVPDTYTVKLVGPGNEPLLVIEDVVVKAGEINRDPRLQEIDVSAFVSSRIVTVVDESEKPIEDAKVVAAEGEGESRNLTKSETGPDGRATVATRAATVEIIVARKGYRAVKLPRVTGDVTVTLRKGKPLTVTIRLAASVALPPAPYTIGVNLQWLCGLDEPRPKDADFLDPRTDHSASAEFDAERTVTREVQTPGVYEVQLWLFKKEAGRHRGGGLEQEGGAATVTVTEEGTASVTVTPDPEALKRGFRE
jgi:hypothetical protein